MGRPETDLAVLEARGARSAKAKRRLSRTDAPIARFFSPAPVPSLDEISQVILEVPGYDPFRDAGDEYVFEPERAQKAVAFFHEQLCFIEGDRSGEAFVLERWQQAIIANLFGWVGSDGRRRYGEAFIYIPRKNGKTPLAAGIVGVLLFQDQEPGAQIYGAAFQTDQAWLVFRHLSNMVEANPDLMDRCKIYKGQQRAIQLVTDDRNIDGIGAYRPIAFNARGSQGYNSSGAVVDELHTFPFPDEFYDALRRSMSGKRRQRQLIVEITTADYSRESLCNEKLAEAKGCVDGTRPNPNLLPVIYEASKEDDYADPAVWRKANPNLGVSKTLDYMEREYAAARDNPRLWNAFLRYELNVVTDTAEQWLSLALWDDCRETEPVDLSDRPCWCGLDLGATNDTSAFVAVFPIDGRYHVRAIFWLPGNDLRERARRDSTDYETFAMRGELRLTEGTVVDYAAVADGIWEFSKVHDVRCLAYDPVYTGPVENRLVKELGFDAVEPKNRTRWVEFRQLIEKLTVGAKAIERCLTARTLRHDGNSLLRNQVANATFIERNNCVKAVKAHERQRIDGVVALEMAMAMASSAPPPEEECFLSVR